MQHSDPTLNSTDEEVLVTPAGEDTVHISFWCAWTPAFRQILHEIKQAKTIAANPTTLPDGPEATVEIGPSIYTAMPYGFNAGGKDENGRHGFFPYVIKDGSVVIAIQDREAEADANTPNVRIEYGALACITHGDRHNIAADVKERLAALGLKVLKDRLSRVDVCADVPISAKGLQHALIDNHIITRARNHKWFQEYAENAFSKSLIIPDTPDDEDKGIISIHKQGLHCTGLTIGTSQIMARVYDKLAKERHNEEMLEALAIRRFKEELPEQVTRLEFQLRRDALRSFAIEGRTDSIETLADWCNYAPDVIKYLYSDWLVFTNRDVDRAHTDRIKKGLQDEQSIDPIHPDWLAFIRAFQTGYGESERHVKRIHKTIKREARAHIAQSIGCDQSAMMRTEAPLDRSDPGWIERFALFRYHSTFQHFEDKKRRDAFWINYQDKQHAHDAAVPRESLANLVAVVSCGVGVTHHTPQQVVQALLSGATPAVGPAVAAAG